MNHDSPLRSSRIVLTAATIIGCVLLVASTWSLLRTRAAHQDQQHVRIANGHFQSEFREFYPANNQVADASVGMTVPSNRSVARSANSRSTVSETSRPVRAVSSRSEEVGSSEQSTSRDDFSTVTQTGIAKDISTAPNVSVPVTINVNNGELLSELIEMRERLNQLQLNQTKTPAIADTPSKLVTDHKYS